jgi:hypothetical protein
MASSTSLAPSLWRSVADPTSIRDSFQHSLPFYAYNPLVDGVYNASSSGQHTSATTAPKFAIRRLEKSWATIGQEFLDEIATKTRMIELALQ